MRKVLSILLGVLLFVQVLVPQTAFADDPSEDDWESLLNPDRDYLVVINEGHPFEFGGDYETALLPDLVRTSDVYYGATARVEQATFLAFTKLQFLLEQKGIRIGLFGGGAGYRTYDQQKGVYDYYSELPGWGYEIDENGEKVILNSVAEPGLSEHHTGLLLNIVYIMEVEEDGETKGIWATETAERVAASPEFFQTLHETLWECGFITRYPLGKEEITGVHGQIQEIRFVGSREIAYEIYSRGICLEEYLAEQTP